MRPGRLPIHKLFDHANTAIAIRLLPPGVGQAHGRSPPRHGDDSYGSVFRDARCTAGGRGRWVIILIRLSAFSVPEPSYSRLSNRCQNRRLARGRQPGDSLLLAGASIGEGNQGVIHGAGIALVACVLSIFRGSSIPKIVPVMQWKTRVAAHGTTRHF